MWRTSVSQHESGATRRVCWVQCVATCSDVVHTIEFESSLHVAPCLHPQSLCGRLHANTHLLACIPHLHRLVHARLRRHHHQSIGSLAAAPHLQPELRDILSTFWPLDGLWSAANCTAVAAMGKDIHRAGIDVAVIDWIGGGMYGGEMDRVRVRTRFFSHRDVGVSIAHRCKAAHDKVLDRECKRVIRVPWPPFICYTSISS